LVAKRIEDLILAEFVERLLSEKVKFYLFLEARNTKEDVGSISPAGVLVPRGTMREGLRGRTRL
jgi:hypothetical protein